MENKDKPIYPIVDANGGVSFDDLMEVFKK